MFSSAIDYFLPLGLGALGVLLMLPVTIYLYRRFLAAPIADKTKTTFIEASDDESFVKDLKNTRLWAELTGETAKTVGTMASKVDSVPTSIHEIIDASIETSTKTIANHVVQEFEKGIQCIQMQINTIEAKLLAPRKFAGGNVTPQEAQTAGVESRRVNQIVSTIEDTVQGGSSILSKANELAQFLHSVDQPELADWLEDHQDAVRKVEQRIRANPQLAARLQQFQQRIGGNAGAGAQGAPAGHMSNQEGISR